MIKKMKDTSVKVNVKSNMKQPGNLDSMKRPNMKRGMEGKLVEGLDLLMLLSPHLLDGGVDLQIRGVRRLWLMVTSWVPPAGRGHMGNSTPQPPPKPAPSQNSLSRSRLWSEYHRQWWREDALRFAQILPLSLGDSILALSPLWLDYQLAI